MCILYVFICAGKRISSTIGPQFFSLCEVGSFFICFFAALLYIILVGAQTSGDFPIFSFQLIETLGHRRTPTHLSLCDLGKFELKYSHLCS